MKRVMITMIALFDISGCYNAKQATGNAVQYHSILKPMTLLMAPSCRVKVAG